MATGAAGEVWSCAPARPLSRAPRFTLPDGAWDCHCHVFGPPDRFTYAPDRPYTPPPSGVAALRDRHRALGVDRAVLVQAACHGMDHSALFDAIADSGGRDRGVMLVADPGSVDFADMHRRGMRGVRFNLVGHLGPPPDPDLVADVAAATRPLGWHLLLHVDPSSLASVPTFLDQDLPVVIDHMARLSIGAPSLDGDLGELLELLSDHRVWIKIAAPDRMVGDRADFGAAVPLARQLIAAAPDRCIWGSDFPHPNHPRVPDDANLVDLIPQFAVDDDIRRRLLVVNPLQLYGAE